MDADNGNLRLAANICDWLLADDRIRGVLSARIQGLLGLVPKFMKSGDRRRSGRAVNALEADEDYWASYPESELWLMVAWGLLLGVAPFRHNWQQRPGHKNRVLPCPEFWHPQHLRYDTHDRKWKMRVQAGAGFGTATELEINPGDSMWILHMPFGSHRPWALGMWRALAKWKLVKELAIEDWSKHGEKGSVLVVESQATGEGFRTQPGNDAKGAEESAQRIYDRGKNAVVSLPTGRTLKLVEGKGQASQLYSGLIDKANEGFAITIRGGNLTTSVEGGSKAAAEVQERTGDFVNLRFDAETLATTLHTQSLPWWADFNFGDPLLAPWPDYPVAPQRNLGAFADVITKVGDACDRLELLGFEVDRAALLEEFELQEFIGPGKRPEPPVPEPGAETEGAPAPAPEDGGQDSKKTPEQENA